MHESKPTKAELQSSSHMSQLNAEGRAWPTKAELNEQFPNYGDAAQDNELVIIWAQSVTNPDAMQDGEVGSHYISQQVFKFEFDTVEDVQRVLHAAHQYTVEPTRLVPKRSED
jgi:hypothetical protein